MQLNVRRAKGTIFFFKCGIYIHSPYTTNPAIQGPHNHSRRIAVIAARLNLLRINLTATVQRMDDGGREANPSTILLTIESFRAPCVLRRRRNSSAIFAYWIPRRCFTYLRIAHSTEYVPPAVPSRCPMIGESSRPDMHMVVIQMTTMRWRPSRYES